jgi:hypothetical protein
MMLFTSPPPPLSPSTRRQHTRTYLPHHASQVRMWVGGLRPQPHAAHHVPQCPHLTRGSYLAAGHRTPTAFHLPQYTSGHPDVQMIERCQMNLDTVMLRSAWQIVSQLHGLQLGSSKPVSQCTLRTAPHMSSLPLCAVTALTWLPIAHQPSNASCGAHTHTCSMHLVGWH